MGFKGARPEIETATLYASYQTADPNHRLYYRSRHSPPLSVRFLLATRILRSRVLSTKCAGQSERTLLVTTKNSIGVSLPSAFYHLAQPEVPGSSSTPLSNES